MFSEGLQALNTFPLGIIIYLLKMSKKRSNKKNLNLDNDSGDDVNVSKLESDKSNLTSKNAKAKATKKGNKKGKKDDDWSGEEDNKAPSLLNNVDEEIQPVSKKATKKSNNHMSCLKNEKY